MNGHIHYRFLQETKIDGRRIPENLVYTVYEYREVDRMETHLSSKCCLATGGGSPVLPLPLGRKAACQSPSHSTGRQDPGRLKDSP